MLGHYLPFFVNFTRENDKFSNKKEGPNPMHPFWIHRCSERIILNELIKQTRFLVKILTQKDERSSDAMKTSLPLKKTPVSVAV